MSVAVTREPFFARGLERGDVPPVVATAVLFLMLYWQPLQTLVRDWLHDPDAAHGLLLAPIAIYLARRSGVSARAHAQPLIGSLLLAFAIVLRFMSGLAAELFTMRLSLLMALAALVVFAWGWRQVARWWLPFGLLVLCIPLPAVVMASLALPLQFKASALGAALLHWRNIPVELTGNVINLPGRSLFVTEACSGLRSLSALLAIALLAGGLWLRTAAARGVLLALALPVAVLLNGVRVFLTGFLVVFVDPRLGDGFMHLTEGWLIYLAALGILGAIASGLTRVERRFVPEAA
jgi:exosortase